MHRTLQGVQKVFENNLCLKRIICAKCAKELRTFQSLKTKKSSTIEDETCSRKSRGLGAITLKGFPRENKGLSKVAKGDFNPYH